MIKFKILNVRSKLIIFATFILFIFGCVSTKNFRFANSYSGKLKSVDFDLNFYAQYDTANNIRFRLYYLTGIKIADFTLMKDSFRIQYLIDDSYQKTITNFYKNYSKSICLYNVTNDLLKGDLFVADSVSSLCYNKEIVFENKKLITANIFSRTYNKFGSITCSKFLTFDGKKFPLLFNLSLPNKKLYNISLVIK